MKDLELIFNTENARNWQVNLGLSLENLNASFACADLVVDFTQ